MTTQFSGNTVDRSGRTDGSPHRSLAQILAFVFGVVFLLAGVGGFIPGVTTPFDELAALGTDSQSELLGLFRVSYLHNVVHLLFGVGIVAAARERWSLAYLIGGGVAYMAVAVFGIVIDQDSDANFLPVNTADNFLHVGLSSGLLAAGLVAAAAARRRHANA